MNTTTVLPLEKKDDFVDVELSYQKTHTIATNNNNKNENKRRINKMVLLVGIVVAMTVGGAVVATTTSKSKLLTITTTTGDEIAVVSSSYDNTCKQTPPTPWSGVSDGIYQTCWKNGPNDFQGNCYTNNFAETSNPHLYYGCRPKGRDWVVTAGHSVTRATCGTQCKSLVPQGKGVPCSGR